LRGGRCSGPIIDNEPSMPDRKLPISGAQMADIPIQIAIARRMLIKATPNIQWVSSPNPRDTPSRFIFG